MPGRTQRRRGLATSWRFRSAPWNVGASGGRAVSADPAVASGQCARFMPPVATDLFPAGLLERFAGEADEALMRLLLFLTPLTVGP